MITTTGGYDRSGNAIVAPRMGPVNRRPRHPPVKGNKFRKQGRDQFGEMLLDLITETELHPSEKVNKIIQMLDQGGLLESLLLFVTSMGAYCALLGLSEPEDGARCLSRAGTGGSVSMGPV